MILILRPRMPPIALIWSMANRSAWIEPVSLMAMVPVAECSWPTVTSVSVMASLVVLTLAVGNCCAMARPGSAMAAPAAPATMPIMILRRCDEGGLEEERCDMRYSFRALLEVIGRGRVDQAESIETKRGESRDRHASVLSLPLCFLLVLRWRIGFAMRRNNTLFDVKPGRRWARLPAPGRTGLARARHGIGAFSEDSEVALLPFFGEPGGKPCYAYISAYVI